MLEKRISTKELIRNEHSNYLTKMKVDVGKLQ